MKLSQKLNNIFSITIIKGQRPLQGRHTDLSPYLMVIFLIYFILFLQHYILTYYNPILQLFTSPMQQESQQPYYQSVAITIIVLNAISFVSLCFVLSIYIYNWRKIASFPMRLSFYLCVACLGQNLYVILLNPLTIHNIEIYNKETTSGYCIFEGILKVWFDLSSIIWTSMIIYSVFASVVLRKSLQSMEIWYLIIAYLLPLIAACIPAALNLYGYMPYFCWFRSSSQNQEFWLKMGFFFIPLWVLFLFNLTLSTKTYLSLKKIELQQRLLTIFKRLMWFPFIMFVTGLFATIDLIYEESTTYYVNWINIVGLVLLSLYGFFNSLAYGFNPLIREKIQICFKGKEESTLNDSRLDEEHSSSRNTQRIQAQLYDIQSVRKQTEPMLNSLNSNNIKK